MNNDQVYTKLATYSCIVASTYVCKCMGRKGLKYTYILRIPIVSSIRTRYSNEIDGGCCIVVAVAAFVMMIL